MLEPPWYEIYILPRKMTLSIKTKWVKRQHLCVPFVAGLTSPWSINFIYLL